MRCPRCDGAGMVQSNDGDHAVTCGTCNGLGVIEE